MRRTLALVGATLAFAACTDPIAPPGPPNTPTVPATNRSVSAVTAQAMLARYVALGTSNSQGVQSAGIFAAGQRAAWPAELARRAGVPFALPLIQDPGCGPALLPPLVSEIVLVGAFGDDLVTAVMNVCAPLRDGVTLPTNSVAISGAKVRDALRSTPETETARVARKGALYTRVLPPGQTQVTRTPVLRSSWARASDQLSTNALVAP